MTLITFKNQYSSYNNPVNKVAKTSDVLPTSAAAATKQVPLKTKQPLILSLNQKTKAF